MIVLKRGHSPFLYLILPLLFTGCSNSAGVSAVNPQTAPVADSQTARFVGPSGLKPASGGHLYVANFGVESTDNGSVTVYALGSKTPSLTITTGISNPGTVAVDSSGTLYVANELGPNANTVSEYASGQTSPARTITGLNLAYGALTNVNGTLYGTTQLGGSTGVGTTVYSLSL